MSKKEVKPVTKTYTYFNLDTFEKVEVEKQIPVFEPKTADEVMEIIANDNSILTKAVNAFLKRAALKEVKKEVAALGGKTSVVMALAKPFRAMPPWSQIFEKNSDGTVKTDDSGEKIVDRKAQSKAIFAFLKSSPEIVDSIKTASLQAVEDDDDEDGEKTEE